MNSDEQYADAVRRTNVIEDELRRRQRTKAAIEYYQYQYSKQNEKDDGFETGTGMVPLPVPVTKTTTTTTTPSPKVSPTLPDHIYVRQEGLPQKAEIYDADTGKHIDNVKEIEVTLNRNASKVRVVANDGERTYPVQDLTVDANGATK